MVNNTLEDNQKDVKPRHCCTEGMDFRGVERVSLSNQGDILLNA